MNSCKIVTYHYVRPLKDSKYPNIKGLELENFTKQVEYFKKNFNFITAEQILDSIYENDDIPKNSMLLTFDDGLKDHYSFVFPLLKKYDIQGLFFPTARHIIDSDVLDVHKIHFILANVKNKNDVVNEIFAQVNGHKKKYDLKSPEEYFSIYGIENRFDSAEIIFIKRMLQRALPKEVRMNLTEYLFKKFVTSDICSFSRELYLSFNEIKEMKESNMYFGSHGYTHDWLSDLTSDVLESEISKSVDFYRKINGNDKNLIMCYPHGNYNNLVIDELKKQKFKAGLTIDVGDAILNTENAFMLKRYDTNDFSM